MKILSINEKRLNVEHSPQRPNEVWGCEVGPHHLVSVSSDSPEEGRESGREGERKGGKEEGREGGKGEWTGFTTINVAMR